MSNPDPSMNWMDRLSDAVGYYYPGGRYLRSRHPIKVTLLMGLLGFCCGWVTMGLFGVGFFLNPVWMPELFPILVGVLFGLMVLCPWTCWIGTSMRKAAWLIVYSAICFWTAGTISLWFILWFCQGSNPAAGSVVWGLVVSTSLSLAGMYISGSWRVKWFLSTVAVNLVVAFLLGLLVEQIQKPAFVPPFIPRELHLPLLIVTFFTTIEAVIAVCLGYLLWDWTSPAVFEPVEDQHPSASS